MVRDDPSWSKWTDIAGLRMGLKAVGSLWQEDKDLGLEPGEPLL